MIPREVAEVLTTIRLGACGELGWRPALAVGVVLVLCALAAVLGGDLPSWALDPTR